MIANHFLLPIRAQHRISGNLIYTVPGQKYSTTTETHTNSIIVDLLIKEYVLKQAEIYFQF